MNATSTHEGPPWDYPEFVVCPGRYYLAHYYVDLPKCAKVPLGGNVAMLLWRYDDEPERWRLAACFRYYRDERALLSKDRKSWYFGTVAKDEAAMALSMDALVQEICGAAGLFTLKSPPEVSRLTVGGDWQRYMEAVRTQKPAWLHGAAAQI